MSKFVNKSIRFDMDSSIIRDFLAAQTNFSKAIKFLIFDYCSKNQIEDLSKKLKEISDEAVLNQMIERAGGVERRGLPITPPTAPPTAPAPESSTQTKIESPKTKTEKKEPEKKVDDAYSEYAD